LMPIFHESSGGATSAHPEIISESVVIRTHNSYVPGSIFSILYTPPGSVSLFPIKLKPPFWRNSTNETKGFAVPLDNRMVPVSDAGCGIAVSVGGTVAVRVGVEVGSGVGVSVEVGAIVAVGSMVICLPQAESSTANNAIITGNCTAFVFIFTFLEICKTSRRFFQTALHSRVNLRDASWS
jgi:hypothetical protein